MTVSEIERKFYPNNKPWITKEIRNLLKQKVLAVENNDVQEKRKIQREITRLVKHGKRKYGKQIEDNFSLKDPKKAWQGLKTITCCGLKNRTYNIAPEKLHDFANELNVFFGRFDVADFSDLNTDICRTLESNASTENAIQLSLQTVENALKKLKANKARGPDWISGKTLKMCYKELSPVFREMFQWSLDAHHIPKLWKSSNVVPIPKIAKPSAWNDYRPVVLTGPFVMKCFESSERTSPDTYQDLCRSLPVCILYKARGG